jgi:hypothetical protein
MSESERIEAWRAEHIVHKTDAQLTSDAPPTQTPAPAPATPVAAPSLVQVETHNADPTANETPVKQD